MICLFSSCDERDYPANFDGETYGTTIVELKANSITHEFIIYEIGAGSSCRMGMAHWPDCKYCKNKTE